MTPAEREALVERMAEAIVPHMGCQDCGTGPGECPCHDAARAALAVAEPVVREECAALLEAMEREHRDALVGIPHTPDYAIALRDAAAAIRRGAP